MTKIVFFRSGGVYYGFEEHGHTGYASAGEDILCSALSAMTMLVINTIEVAYASNVEYTIDDGAAHIMVRSKSALVEFEEDERKRYAISGLFMSYFYQLNDLREEYYDFLDVEVKDIDYI
jgi:uncharacterized protein YsxB (DUF464 family)